MDFSFNHDFFLQFGELSAKLRIFPQLYFRHKFFFIYMYFLKVLLKEKELNFVTNLHNMVFRCILRMSLITKAYTVYVQYTYYIRYILLGNASLPSKNFSKLEFCTLHIMLPLFTIYVCSADCWM